MNEMKMTLDRLIYRTADTVDYACMLAAEKTKAAFSHSDWIEIRNETTLSHAAGNLI